MVSDRRHAKDDETGERSQRRGSLRPLSILILFVLVLVLTQIPVASAGHGAAEATQLTQGHGVLLAVGGVITLGGVLTLKRTDRVSPTNALYGAFVGLAVTALGVTVFSATSPEPTYAASSMPFPRSWYVLMALSVGSLIMVLSFIVGWLRWPTRPRYTFFGILMGLWIAYPYLIPGSASDTHPLGYAIVFGTPVFVGYIIWKDAGNVLSTVLRDPVARRFGIGVGAIVALYFISVTGYLSFVPEPGVYNRNEQFIGILHDGYQLVNWPLFFIYLPDVPLVPIFLLAISPGLLVVTGMLSALVGLNAAVIARQWRVEEQAGKAQSTAGPAGLVGCSTCGCCGPLVAKVAILAAGPSIAAPLYWVFVDTASPLSALFIVASIVLFVGSLIYSVEAASQPTQTNSLVPAD